MADALTSKGATIKSASMSEAMPNVSLISGPTRSAPDIDVTHLGVTGNYRQFLGDYLDGGEVSLEFFYDPSVDEHKEAAGGIKRLFNEQTEEVWTYTLSDENTITFSARVSALEGPDVAVGQGMTMRATLRVSGPDTMPS